MKIAPFILAETMAARITASAVDFAAVGAKIPAAQKAVNSRPSFLQTEKAPYLTHSRM